jgi:hypothetical protein
MISIGARGTQNVRPRPCKSVPHILHPTEFNLLRNFSDVPQLGTQFVSWMHSLTGIHPVAAGGG